jgi:hypothetical protein
MLTGTDLDMRISRRRHNIYCQYASTVIRAVRSRAVLNKVLRLDRLLDGQARLFSC